jgi:hypothetical protein
LYKLSKGKAGARLKPKYGALFVVSTETTTMAKKKGIDPVKSAEEEAEKDILQDPELSDSDPTDDLDEGELAQRDNSDEEAFDELEKKRPDPKPHPHVPHPQHPANPGKK